MDAVETLWTAMLSAAVFGGWACVAWIVMKNGAWRPSRRRRDRAKTGAA